MTESIQQYLAQPPEERDVAQGALLLLRINRNRIVYEGALRCPRRYAPIIEAELKKHLRIRLDHQTRQSILRMEQEVMPAAEHTLAQGAPIIDASEDRTQSADSHRGLRADHASLPAEIQAIPERNADIYFKMKQTFETLKQLSSAAPCDRYEHLKELSSLDREIRANWKRYDEYGEGGGV